MKIAYFTDTYLPSTDGVVTSIKTITENLRILGHEVFVFCPSGISENRYRIPIPSKEFQRYPQYKVSFPSFEIITKVQKINPDIIHIHTPVTIGLTGLYLGKILNIPTVITYHTRLESYMWYLRSKENDNFTETFTTWLYNQCPVIVPSKSIKDILIEKNVKSKIDIIPSPVNLQLTSKNPKEHPVPVILHVGRLSREKQIDVILRAYKKILRKHEAKLVITSTGPDENRLKKYAEDLNIEEKVSFTGFLSIEKIRNNYSKADIFVTASNTETQGLVVLEAMANGCAVIARKAPGFIDVIKDGANGLFFEKEEELVENILILLEDEVKRNNLTKGGYKTVEIYSPSLLISRLEEYYNQNLSQPREPTVERLLYSVSIIFSFLVYDIVRKLDLPINSRLSNVTIDVLKLLLIVARFLRI